MKVVNVGVNYDLYDDSLKTYDKLPAGIYSVFFSKTSGFRLIKHNDFDISEKIYGCHEEKVDKIIRSFDLSERNLGVILSGHKGIGKSITAKLLANQMVRNGHPVILVEEYVPGINKYLESIEQECMVMFDEFEKTFRDNNKDGDVSPQESMLTLFDGLSTGKKLFVVTCNNYLQLNGYLINRPGRFHYHIRFDYPHEEEIRQYLEDKVISEYVNEIHKVIKFSKRVNLNYDCLRSIAFELNTGAKFEEAIKDLNIINNSDTKFDVTLVCENNIRITMHEMRYDTFSEERKRIEFKYKTADFYTYFNFKDSVLDNNEIIIPAENLEFDWEEDYNEKEEVETLKALKPLHLQFVKSKDKGIHYAV